MAGNDILRQVELTAPVWVYPAAERLLDGAGVTIRVAQLSDRFGAGPERSISVV